MNEQLKPCPFCDGEALLKTYYGSGKEALGFVYCKECGVTTRSYESINAAIEAWNRRAYEQK